MLKRKGTSLDIGKTKIFFSKSFKTDKKVTPIPSSCFVNHYLRDDYEVVQAVAMTNEEAIEGELERMVQEGKLL